MILDIPIRNIRCCWKTSGRPSTRGGQTSLSSVFTKGGRCLMVTYDGLFQFCMVIIGIINLVYLIAKKK